MEHPLSIRIISPAISFLLVAGIISASSPPAFSLVPPEERTPLNVYTYRSFISEWGPGPEIERRFEELCYCDVVFTGVEDGVSLLNRLRFEGEDSPADVVIGLDSNLMAEAKALDIWARHEIRVEEYLTTASPEIGSDGNSVEQPEIYASPIIWEHPFFVPYDWGYFAFIYDSETVSDLPQSLRELVYDSDLSVIIQDPRSSTPGMGLLIWMKTIFGEEALAAWESLTPRIVTVTNGWSEAYNLFLEGESDLVLSYHTSPAYHREVENIERYRALEFVNDPYVMQIEIAGYLAHSADPALARQFLEFLLLPEIQTVLATTNWMYPANPRAQLPDSFSDLIPISLERSILPDPEEVAEHRQDWITEWLNAF